MNHELPVDERDRARTLDTKQSFLVQAPAGSGKTELLTRRVLKLLAEVDQPEEILAITFTKAATAEMLARVLHALHDAQAHLAGSDESELRKLARAALANDSVRGWHLLEQPQRLNIQTIDAVCMSIAYRTPILSRLGGSLSPTDHPQPLYLMAARRTLARLGKDSEVSQALRALLQLRGTSLSDCETLIAGMLDKRDQWARVLPFGHDAIDWAEVRQRLDAPLRNHHARVLANVQLQFSKDPELAEELVDLVAHACGNLDPDAELMKLKDVTSLAQLTSAERWKGLCGFLLTGRVWRKMAPHVFAKDNEGAEHKKRYKELLTELSGKPETLALLHEILALPPERYTDEQFQILRHLLLILRYAMAELNLVFSERSTVDFVELGMAANRVLSDDEGKATDRASDVAEQWRHVLVDEFQDTSRSQYELLTLLAEGWESAGRGTFFLVGDPMQSIYLFRQAEVELFERTRRLGLGEETSALHLTPLRLQTNFRSHAGLVDRLNELFKQVFGEAPSEAGHTYHVAFSESSASRPRPPNSVGVRVWPFLLPPKASPDQKLAMQDAQASRVVQIVQQHWPEIQAKEKAKQKEQGEFRVAVLVRAKAHLALITRKLREAGIPFRAVEIEQLGDRQEVKDVTALTRALLHPMDRIAWLTILRAPWCGLTLKDLHVLCGSDAKEYRNRPVLSLLQARGALLSDDGQRRVARVQPVLEEAVSGKHRQVSLSQWVERTWATLGGHACVDGAGYENLLAFFAMLEELGWDTKALDERIAELCAQPDPHASERCGVQLMSIHKAKGLGFDVVIVPGLERGTGSESRPLIRWIEQTRLVGEEELEEKEFVVSPIGRKGERSALYDWIGRQLNRREDEEAKRLIYVAATRAREELHLLGTATVKVAKDGSHEVGPGKKRSLLGIAWPALEGDFARALAEETAAPRRIETALPEATSTIQLRRLPMDWKPSVVAAAVDVEETATAERWERPQGSLALRALGTVVHGLLEDIAGLGGIADGEISQAAVQEVRGWRGRALAMLRSHGLPHKEAESQSTKVIDALVEVLSDPDGRWILGARADAETEVSWSAWADAEGGEIVRTLRGDRIFRAGATPRSDGNSHIWIVDYKTGRAGGKAIDKFLQQEKEKYRPQLDAYGEVMRKVHGDDIPLRLALYYPLLKRLVWW